MDFRIAGLLWLLAAPSAAQDSPVPVESEPHHKTIIKNEYIQAFRVAVDPGQATLMHTHALDDVAVRLSHGTITSETQGKPAGAPEQVDPGLVTARDNEKKPYTHRVRNTGTTPFEALDVQVLKRPDGPATEPIVKPAAENAKMRAYRYELAPGASTGEHVHKRPYLLVAATDVDLKMVAVGMDFEHKVKKGDTQWVSSEVTHTLTNRGSAKAVLVEVELK